MSPYTSLLALLLAILAYCAAVRADNETDPISFFYSVRSASPQPAAKAFH